MMSSGSSNNNLNSGGRKQQLSSFILFASVILFVNLCPFHQDFPYNNNDGDDDLKFAELTPTTTETTLTLTNGAKSIHSIGYTFYGNCLRFVKLMFTNPIRLGKRATRFSQADAAMIGKMAKVWYIKKKIKKLGKKLKKHTIAVPVFTAIPIYEHSYYPQHPHVTHMSHMGASGHHAAAASSYMPTFIATATTPATLAAQQSSTTLAQLASSAAGQLATSASNTNQYSIPAYHRMMGPPHALAHHAFHPPRNNHPHQHHPHPNPHHANHNQNQHHASASQIINAYPPSPPLYVDEAGGLYGHYGNAYGRYDGGYQVL